LASNGGKVRYGALRTIASFFKTLAWIAVVVGVIASVAVAVAARGWVHTLWAFLGGLVATGVSFLLLYAYGEFIYLFIDIEQNTRGIAERLKQREGL